MAELAQEGGWLCPDPTLEDAWGTEPLTLTHGLGAFQFDMAVDCANAMAHLIENLEPGYIWSPAALLRPILEGAGRSSWLFEPGIGTKERLRRGTNDRLEGLHWQAEYLPTSEARRRAKLRTRQIHDAAQLLGFEVVPKRQFLEPGRPSTTKVIEALFAVALEPAMAKVFMLFSSAFVHAGPLALISFLHAPKPEEHPLHAKTSVALTDMNANLLLASAIASLVLAGRARLSFFGWEPPEWQTRASEALGEVVKTMQGYRVNESG